MKRTASNAQRIVLTAGLGLALTGIASPALAAVAPQDLSRSIYNVPIDTAELNRIAALLPETTVNTAYVSPSLDPNLHLLEKAEISLTFISEGAGYRNSFGYFLYDDAQTILSKETIFSNASAVGSGGSLKPGDTVKLGTFEAGTNIGFWLQGDGFTNKNGYTYYTLDQYNPDGKRHVAVIADVLGEQIVLGIEDLYNLGDRDYNDVVFTFSANPFSAIDIAGMPTGAPEAGPIATAMISATMFGAFASRRRRKAGSKAGSNAGAAHAQRQNRD